MNPLNKYDLYLFDADGTIIDTEELIYTCYRETCLKFAGYEVDRSEVTKYMGIPLLKMLRLFLPELSEEKLRESRLFYSDFQKTIYADFLRLFPGVKETLKALKDQGKILGVVTSRSRNSLNSYIELLEIASYFDFTVTPEDTIEHKPHPEPVYKAMEKALSLDESDEASLSPENILFIGDAEFDIQSGNRAGTHTALVLWGHNEPQDIKSTTTHLLKNMEDLL